MSENYSLTHYQKAFTSEIPASGLMAMDLFIILVSRLPSSYIIRLVIKEFNWDNFVCNFKAWNWAWLVESAACKMNKTYKSHF